MKMIIDHLPSPLEAQPFRLPPLLPFDGAQPTGEGAAREQLVSVLHLSANAALETRIF